jgi:hypothetical protein
MERRTFLKASLASLALPSTSSPEEAAQRNDVAELPSLAATAEEPPPIATRSLRCTILA